MLVLRSALIIFSGGNTDNSYFLLHSQKLAKGWQLEDFIKLFTIGCLILELQILWILGTSTKFVSPKSSGNSVMT